MTQARGSGRTAPDCEASGWSVDWVIGHELEVLADPAAAARRGAELICESARDAIAERGGFSLALSGGTAPWQMLGMLAGLEIDWERVDVFQVDERVAPDGDPDRNLTHLLESLPQPARDRLRPMRVGAGDLDAAAAQYAAGLPERIDLVHLGLGEDGHTASLVPGDPVLEAIDRRVALTAREYQGRRRMTFTYPELAHARRIFWLIVGEQKRDPVGWLLASDHSIPAAHVHSEDSLIIADEAAAASHSAPLP